MEYLTTPEGLTELLVSLFLVIGGLFGLVGSFGLIKLRQTMQRLHAPTKATTLGVGGVLLASMVYFHWIEGAFTFHELLITIFLFLTAPITANFIAKTFAQGSVKPEALPPSGSDYGWSVYDFPPGDPSEEAEEEALGHDNPRVPPNPE